MIQLRGVTLLRGVKRLLDGASLAVHPGQKIGIIGGNGCGKSSLFRLLLNDLHPEAGDVSVPARWVVATVEQETEALDRVAIEFVIDGDAELRTIESDLAEAEAAEDGMRQGELHGRLGEIDGYGARARAATLLSGLGFAQVDHARPVADFSGGWRVRLQVARALMSRSDLLLLDEPTNHLDLDAVIWLEQWLKAYPGTLLVISHDREFLDNVVGAVCHFESKQLKLYSGGYSDFERARAEALDQQNALHVKQQRQISHLESYIERFRAKATKARQAQSRIKALDRIKVVARAQADAPFDFEFADPGGAADPLLLLEHVVGGYGGTRILDDVTINVRPGSRIGLLGRNGAGKSTLTKLMAGTLPPMTGERLEGKGLRIGYFAQHQLEQLRPDDTPLRHMTRLDPRTREQDHRDFLGGFGFRGDEALMPVGPMSGGEKARLALALIVYTKPHLLLLDEPTNHLDLAMRAALMLALQSFTGALVLVSHDRSLLRTAVDEFLLVADGKVSPFDGDLDDYRDWLSVKPAVANSAPGPAPDSGASRRDKRRDDAVDRGRAGSRRKPLQQEITTVDRALAQLQGQRLQLEKRLAAPDIHQGANRQLLADCTRDLGQAGARIRQLEDRWFVLHEQLEQFTDTV